jgi:nicotinate phosphoribosyltransferase
MRNGARVEASPPLSMVREHAASQLARLPERLRSLKPAPPYLVTVAEPLRALAHAVDRAQETAGA